MSAVKLFNVTTVLSEMSSLLFNNSYLLFFSIFMMSLLLYYLIPCGFFVFPKYSFVLVS